MYNNLRISTEKKDIPNLNKLLNKFAKELKEFGVDSYIIVASDHRHLLGGGSVTHNPKRDPNDPVTLLENKFVKWEKENGISRKHDWNKDGYRNL